MRVELSETAIADLDLLIRIHSLPTDTRDRVRGRLRDLERFPRLGVSLGGRWSGLRAILGPWRWLVVVYTILDDPDRVVVVTMHDARSIVDLQG